MDLGGDLPSTTIGSGSSSGSKKKLIIVIAGIVLIVVIAGLILMLPSEPTSKSISIPVPEVYSIYSQDVTLISSEDINGTHVKYVSEHIVPKGSLFPPTFLIINLATGPSNNAAYGIAVDEDTWFKLRDQLQK